MGDPSFPVQVDLRLEDYQQVANTLVYDGEVEETTEFDPDEDADTTFYRVSPMTVPETNAFTSIPCGVCPVRGLPRSSFHRP
jgi:DNA-directed RNA polymerase III subunit RPC6